MGFDQQRVDLYCNFFERLLKLTEDEFYGQPFKLLPWPEEVLHGIVGPSDDFGNPLVDTAYLEVTKKSSKTTFCAGLTLAVFCMENTPGCQAYGAGAVTRQALNVYRIACKMVEQEPQLSARLRIMRGTNRIIKRNDPESFYAAVAGDGDFSDGVNPRFVVADEVHRWKTRKHLENWDVLSNSGIARKQTLTIAITTAGVKSESPLAWRLHEKVLKTKEGVINDPTFYGRIWAADPGDDWKDEKTWIKACPALKQNGGYLDISKYREKYEAALGDPEAQRTFRRYFLNLWDEKTNRAIDMAKWKAGSGEHKLPGLLPLQEGQECRTLPHETLKRFIDRRCWAGVDMSMTTDLSAVTLLFPPVAGEAWDVLWFPYLPASGIANRERRDGMPFRTWAEQGYLELPDGEVIDHREVRKRLEWAREMFDLREVCFDRYNSREISVPMVEAGYKCVDVAQDFGLNEATKKILKLIVELKFHHGSHPVATWHASCISTFSKNDLVKPSKPEREKETARIDLLAAAVTAMSRAMLATDKRSIYETSAVI